MTVRIINADVLDGLRALPDESVQCVVTSPPYWGLRNYGVPGQIGLEKTPQEYVAKMVEVFREVRRVLKDDGVLFLNLGDSYAASSNTGGTSSIQGSAKRVGSMTSKGHDVPPGLKPKDLVGIPWRVAFALQADGWYLRSDIIWSKPNPMPESVRDRPTKAHEYVFLLSKSQMYFYDAVAVSEKAVYPGDNRAARKDTRKESVPMCQDGGSRSRTGNPTASTRNLRSVWSIATQPFPEAHFATFPEKLVERCILAGSREGDTVLDPFGGSGTVGLVAERLGRDSILVELNQKYCEMAKERTAQRRLL